jgi:hypothetical protein
MFGLNFVIKLSSFQQLNAHINRVLRLIDLVELHQASVVEFSHYLDLVYQRFFPKFLTVGPLLRKGFHC